MAPVRQVRLETRPWHIRYERFVQHQLEHLKTQLPHHALIALGERAAVELLAEHDETWQITEQDLESRVNRICAQTLRLPELAKWRTQAEPLLLLHRDPSFWHLPRTAPGLEALRAVRVPGAVLGMGPASAPDLGLASMLDHHTTLVADDPTLLTQVEQRAATTSPLHGTDTVWVGSATLGRSLADLSRQTWQLTILDTDWVMPAIAGAGLSAASLSALAAGPASAVITLPGAALEDLSQALQAGGWHAAAPHVWRQVPPPARKRRPIAAEQALSPLRGPRTTSLASRS